MRITVLSIFALATVQCGSFDCGAFTKIGDVSDELSSILQGGATVADLDAWAGSINESPESVRADSQARIDAALDVTGTADIADTPLETVPDKLSNGLKIAFGITTEASSIAKAICDRVKDRPAGSADTVTVVKFGRE